MEYKEFTDLFYQQGLQVIPCGANKRPTVDRWRDVELRQIGEELLASADCIAIRCGDGVECLDYDKKNDDGDNFGEAMKLLSEDLYQRLYIESTPSGGKHIWYRCADASHGNQVLAQSANGRSTWETRADGGYAIVAPSPGYEVLQGDLTVFIPEITRAERDMLFTAARAQNKFVQAMLPESKDGIEKKAKSMQQGYLIGYSPFDEYDRRGEALPLLLEHKWEITGKRNEVYYLRRPGKTEGAHSATLNYVGKNILYVFSTDAQPFDAQRSYRPSDIYIQLVHGGNIAAALADLAEQGYGTAGTVGTEYERIAPDTAMAYIMRGQEGFADLITDLHGGKVTPSKFAAGRVMYVAAEHCWYIFTNPANIRVYDPEDPHNQWFQDGAEPNIVRALVVDSAINICTIAITYYGELLKSNTLEGYEFQFAEKAYQRAQKALTKIEDNASYVTGILTRYRSRVTTRAVSWDANPEVIAVANGLLSLTDRSIRPQRPSDYVQTTAPVEYDRAATAPTWERVYSDIIDDYKSEQWFRRWLGYCLSGHIKEHYHPILYGAEGRNGKDTIINAISATLGGYTGQVSPAALMVRSSSVGSATPEIIDLQGKRIGWLNETNESDKINLASLKQLSGSQTLKGRALYRGYVEFRNTTKIHTVTNALPRINADDSATWARLVVIEFRRRYFSSDHPDYDPDNPLHGIADKDLSDKLRNETAGILNWLLDAYAEYRKHGLGAQPESMREALKVYRADQDSIGMFAGECLREAQGTEERHKNIYMAYLRWCKDLQIQPRTSNAVSRALQGMGYQRANRGGIICWRDIALKPDFEPVPIFNN